MEETRAQFGGRAFLSAINEPWHASVAQVRLGELVAEMEQEAGPASAEAHERVFAQWLTED